MDASKNTAIDGTYHPPTLNDSDKKHQEIGKDLTGRRQVLEEGKAIPWQTGKRAGRVLVEPDPRGVLQQNLNAHRVLAPVRQLPRSEWAFVSYGTP